MTEEVIGIFSLSWQERTLDELCSLRRELVEPSSVGANRYVGLEHIDPGTPQIRRWGNDSDIRSTKNRFYAGDILYGKLRPYLDKAALADWNGICSTDILTLAPRSNVAYPKYLSFLLHTSAFLAHAIATTSGVNHPRTSWADIARFPYPVPPFLEQRAIAAVLSKIQTAVEIQKKIVATVKELKAATMVKLFREGPRGEPLKQTEIGEIPDTWELAQVGDLLKLSSGTTRPDDLSTTRTEATPFPVYGGNGVMGYSSEYLTERESIVIGRVGVYCGSVHVCPEHSWVTDNALYNRDPVSEQVSLHFLAELLAHIKLNRLHRKGAQPLITQGTVHNVMIVLPPKPKQEAIAHTAGLLDTAISAAEQKLATLKASFSSMLHLLMTGQVRVNHLSLPEVEKHAS